MCLLVDLTNYFSFLFFLCGVEIWFYSCFICCIMNYEKTKDLNN